MSYFFVQRKPDPDEMRSSAWSLVVVHQQKSTLGETRLPCLNIKSGPTESAGRFAATSGGVGELLQLHIHPVYLSAQHVI